jgi:hypothetical protein
MIGAGLLLPFWYFVPFVLLYAFFYTPYELLVLGVCIDSVFGDTALFTGYAYTITVALTLLLITALKPHLKFYN